MANIILHHSNNLPRTRSGRGWFISSNEAPIFVASIIKDLFSVHGVAVFAFGPDLMPLYTLFLTSRFTSDQEYAEAMMAVVGFGGLHEVRAIVEDAIQSLPHAGWVHRRIPNDAGKVGFIGAIVDKCFEKNSSFAIDTMQNFLVTLVPLLHKARQRYVSKQGQVQYVVRELKRIYTQVK